MNKKNKLLLSLSCVSVCVVPAFAVLSGSCTNYKQSKTDLEKAVNFVNDNILVKDVARWIRPTEINSHFSKLLTFSNIGPSFVETELFEPASNRGFTFNNLRFFDPNDQNGTIKIYYELSRGPEFKKYTRTLSGFLTSESDRINKLSPISTALTDLDINNSPILPLALKSTETNKNVESYANLSFENLLDKLTGDKKNSVEKYLKNKDTTLPVLKISDRPYKLKVAGIEFPRLVYSAYLEKDGKRSSTFSIAIDGMEKKMDPETVEKLISFGVFHKSTIPNTLPSQVNIKNVQNYFLEDLSSYDSFTDFANADNVSVKVKKFIGFNDNEGSLELEFEIKFDRNANKSSEATLYRTKVYGFKIQNWKISRREVGTPRANIKKEELNLSGTVDSAKSQITSNWILNNKDKLLSGSLDLLKSNDHILNVNVTSSSADPTTMIIEFKVKAGKTYTHFGYPTLIDTKFIINVTGFDQPAVINNNENTENEETLPDTDSTIEEEKENSNSGWLSWIFGGWWSK